MGLTRTRLRVEGIVQGVGFRPFVHALAGRLGLAGLVGNDPGGVFVEVEGPAETVERFCAAMAAEAPPLAVIERVTATQLVPTGIRGFAIAPSQVGGERQALVSPDTATCADCLRELDDPTDRRHRYPFINCTNCGPRFTIVRDVPYDRPATTMAGFAMCADCAREYHAPADRRFHAQPVCCPACGPALALLDRDGRAAEGDPLSGAAARLRDGAVVAVKGLGGYHLAADAASEPAVAALRARKRREDKPFAVMVADLDGAHRLCVADPAEEAMLASPRRPIVLLRRRPSAAIAGPVAPQNRSLGVMLPYTPLHHLLLAEVGSPIVLTSGNVSDEPIAYRDDEALERLGGIADWFLVNDRPIHVRADDSVVRAFRGRELPLRRSRGFAPQPLGLPWPFPRHVLACGAELKHTFCLAKGGHAFVSHHIGDLENYETFRSFTEGVGHFRRLFAVEPEVVAHDLHPEYLSTKYALELDGVELEGVQHHHGGRPLSSRAWATSSTTSGNWSWRPDRLMLRVGGFSRGGLLRCHSAACRQASRSTQAPRGRISPLASARGMNSVGATSPRAGWFQRARASAPTIWPDPRSKVGWYWRNSSPASRARRRSLSSCTRWTSSVCISGS
jgi:hydrogenase maturation protein HypF